MTVRQFGNAFKQAVAEELAAGRISLERAQKIYPRNQAGDKVAGSREMLNADYDYNQFNVNNINDVGGSVIIDT